LNDIVERLRTQTSDSCDIAEMMSEAADEIVRLRAERDRLRDERDAARTEAMRMAHELTKARGSWRVGSKGDTQ
jgi:chromosome segregation ATPase